MNTLKQRLTTNWHPMRIIKLVFGIWAGIQAFQVHDIVIGIFAVFFLYQAVSNTGCCGTQACHTPPLKRKAKEPGYIDFEEIK